MPDYILNVTPPLTVTVPIILRSQTNTVTPIADFSSASNSQYAFLFNMAGFTPPPPDPSVTPFADFSNAGNSQYGFLFNLGV